MPSRVTKALKIVKRALDSLASRYLFDNWFSLLIRYALFRLGFDVRLMARVGDCTFELRPEIFACLVVGLRMGWLRLVVLMVSYT
jgi:hypothetical protein